MIDYSDSPCDFSNRGEHFSHGNDTYEADLSKKNEAGRYVVKLTKTRKRNSLVVLEVEANIEL